MTRNKNSDHVKRNMDDDLLLNFHYKYCLVCSNGLLDKSHCVLKLHNRLCRRFVNSRTIFKTCLSEPRTLFNTSLSE